MAITRQFSVLALTAIVMVLPASADASSPRGLDAAATPPVRVIPAVAAPVSRDPVGAVRGTMIMVHGGVWAGHSPLGRDLLMKTPGDVLVERGWRVVSIDHEEGTAGLQDVLNAVGAELKHRPGGGPVCIYGESSGAHFALVAASRLRAVDCVIGLGTPTDVPLYESAGAVSNDFRVRLVAGQIRRFFGTTPEAMAPWDPVFLAPSIRADALLINEGDDAIVPALHMARYRSARPTTQILQLASGNPGDPSAHFVHATISAAGRAQYASAIGSFTDRAVADRQAQRSAVRTGCAGVNRPLTQVGLPRMHSALRCLARSGVQASGAGSGDWRQTRVTVRGDVSAARIWALLRASKNGRRALAAAAGRRTKVIVRTGDGSRVIVRAVR